MISINSLSISFGSDILLDNVGFNLDIGEKVGLVGRNGAGKSTLLKIICGLLTPNSGRIDRPRDLKFGYLPQVMSHNRGCTVLDEVLKVFEKRFESEYELAWKTEQLSSRTDYETESYSRLIEEINELTDRLAAEGSEPPQALAGKVLRGLGFQDEDFGKNTETFSQGWNMRIELAKILLARPDVMLLDEPTNHLDIESIEWLENFLKKYKGAVLLVSHDKRFLDNLTTRTIEISLGRLYDYRASYSKYLELRKERILQQESAFQNQQKMIEKTEAFIERFRYKATKSNQVQSRIKALERLDRIEIDGTDSSSVVFKFPLPLRSGDIVYSAKKLSAGYPGKTVFSGADIEIKRGDKIAFVGRNGEGKTTQLRIIAGELAPLSGESTSGHNVKYGYFAQNQEDILDKDDTVFGTLDKIATGEIRGRLRDLLAQFLFRGDDIEKKVSVLSGGERARLGIARIMLGEFNCLLLDEPTNHMDIRSKEMLKNALKAYDGTVIVVSHDRDFLDGLTDRLYIFRDGMVKEFSGDINDFLSTLDMDSLYELERNAPPKNIAVKDLNSEGNASYQIQKKENRDRQKLLRKIDCKEQEIENLAIRLKDLENLLANPEERGDVITLTKEYQEVKQMLDVKTAEWEGLIESMG